MENPQLSSKKKTLMSQEEKLIREVNYDSSAVETRSPRFLLDLELFKNKESSSSQRILVTIIRKKPIIKSLAPDRSKLNSGTISINSNASHTIGDSTSIFSDQTHLIDHDIYCYESESVEISKQHDNHININPKCTDSKKFRTLLSTKKHTNIQKCIYLNREHLTMNVHEIGSSSEINCPEISTSDKSTFINLAESASDDSTIDAKSAVTRLTNRVNRLEKKLLHQENVIRSLYSYEPMSSSDEDSKENAMRKRSDPGRAGCSYIEQYSHVPDSPQFHRYGEKANSLTQSKPTNMDKEHSSEQYGRDFTTYDGITARGKRHSVSVPCKREEVPNKAAERIHKIRHKLNPVHDYRLMDTVHYLAQGEFAPRDDGIKLTPSREAVLSDIIWEDVCRTHWPNARLSRRIPNPDRYNTRHELQRLIDNLLRERIAHVERRRRRHYRIVKLNHRHENYRTVGKTGDIIVASHKSKESNRDVAGSEHKATNAKLCDKSWTKDSCSRKCYRSHDHLSQAHPIKLLRDDDCKPGPSSAGPRIRDNVDTTFCYRTSTDPQQNRSDNNSAHKQAVTHDANINVSVSKTFKRRTSSAKLLVKKEIKHKKADKDTNLDHYILLPTLVMRTPSNVKRQKRFHDLYHRILNVQSSSQGDDLSCAVGFEAVDSVIKPPKVDTKDIGLNIYITLSDHEDLNKN